MKRGETDVTFMTIKIGNGWINIIYEYGVPLSQAFRKGTLLLNGYHYSYKVRGFLGSVVRKPISANPGLQNVVQGF